MKLCQFRKQPILFFIGMITVPCVQATDAVQCLKQATCLALEGQTVPATQALYNGLQGLHNHAYADTVMKEMWDILTLDELKSYEEATDKGHFLLRAWQRRDPSPATDENERYVEHVKRLAYARQWYRSPQPRGYDDRGMIYVRYGEPDDYIIMRSHQILRPNEAWRYQINGTLSIMNFWKTGALYRLRKACEPTLPIQFAKSSQVFKQYFESRASLHPLYMKAALLDFQRRTLRLNGNPESLRFIRQLESEYITLPRSQSNLEPLPPIHGQIETARFYRNGKTRFEIYYAIPLDELKPIAPTSNTVQFRLACKVTDDAMTVFDRVDTQGEIAIRRKAAYYTHQINLKCPPGDTEFAMVFADNNSEKAFSTQKNIQGFDASQEAFFISDLQLATSIQPAPHPLPKALEPYVKHDLLIRPHVAKTVNSRRPLHLYFELYNLTADPAGSMHYTVTYALKRHKSGLQNLNPFSKKVTRITSTFKQTARDRNTPCTFSVDLSRIEPGNYTLNLQIRDTNTGTSQSTHRALNIAH